MKCERRSVVSRFPNSQNVGLWLASWLGWLVSLLRFNVKSMVFALVDTGIIVFWTHLSAWAMNLMPWLTMPLIGRIMDLGLYFTKHEQLSNTINRSDHRFLLAFYKYLAIIGFHCSVRSLIFAHFARLEQLLLISASNLQVLSNYPTPLIGQIDNCLYFASLYNYLMPLISSSLEQLSDAIHRSEHWYLLVLYKSWAIIQCHWWVRLYIYIYIYIYSGI